VIPKNLADEGPRPIGLKQASDVKALSIGLMIVVKAKVRESFKLAC
jgi:hypothetical protein